MAKMDKLDSQVKKKNTNKWIQILKNNFDEFWRQDCPGPTARMEKMVAMDKKALLVIKAHRVKMAEMDKMEEMDRMAKMDL